MIKQKISISKKYQKIDIIKLPLVFDEIIHLSDLHIKPLKRHEEYQQVFNKLYDQIGTINNNKIIAITGDLFDNKSNFRPETIQIARSFLKKLATIAPVILIAGNHDLFETNVNRMDAITPFVDIDNLYYCKTSGLYECQNNVCFVVSSLLDKIFITAEQARIETSKKLIALYHGTITSTESTESIKTTRNRQLREFEGFDAVLLGDIHLQQAIQLKSGTMAYAGSLIQQNHGEPRFGHGYLVWTISEAILGASGISYKFHEIYNDYGFVDIICNNGHWLNSDINLPKYCYARLVITNCTETQTDEIIAVVRERTESLDITQEQCDNETISDGEIPIDVVRERDENELLIELAIAKGYQESVDKLIQLHQLYQELEKSTREMSIATMRPIMMTFMNLFGYGNNHENVVHFTRGAMGVNAPNAFGKTSLSNILIFALFGRTTLGPASRTTPFDIINHNETHGFVRLLIKYGEKHYLIERNSGKLAKANVQFKHLNRYEFSCGVWESNIRSEKLLNVTEHRKCNTDTFLREIVGDIDTFSMLNILNKESSMDILSLSGTDQMSHLKRLFKLDVFDKYKDLNKDALKKIKDNVLRLRGTLDTLVLSDINTVISELNSLTIAEDTDLLVQMKDNLTELNELMMQQRDKAQDLKYQISNSERNAIEINKTPAELRAIVSHICSSTGFNIATLQAELNTIPPMTSSLISHDIIDKYANVSILPLIQVQREIGMIQGRLRDLPDIQPQTQPQLQTQPQIESEIKRLEELCQSFVYNKGQHQFMLKQISRLVEYAAYEYVDDIKLTIDELQKIKDNHPYTQGAILIDENALCTASNDLEQLRSQLVILKKSPGARPQPNALNIAQHKLTALTNMWTHTEAINIVNGLPFDGSNFLMTPNEHNGLLVSLGSEAVDQERQQLRNDVDKLQQLESYYADYDNNLKLEKAINLLQNNYNFTINQQTSEDLLLWTNIRDYYTAKRYIDMCCYLEQLNTAKQTLLIMNAKKERQTLMERLNLLQEYQLYYDSIRNLRREELLDLIKTETEYHEYLSATKALEWLVEKDHIITLRNSMIYAQAQLKEIQDNIKVQTLDIAMQQTLLNDMTIKKGILEAQYKTIEHDTERRILIREAINIDEQQIKLLEMYDTLIGNKGMPARMLYVKLLAVEDYINKIMAFSKYKVHISMEEGRNEITVLVRNEETNKWLSTQRLSGYEKLLLQIAFKRALNKYSYNTKCGLVILDEALDCIDQENFQSKLPDIINMITKDYFTCLAISQRDISHICEKQITIRKHEGNSIID